MITSIPDICANRGIPPLQTVLLRLNMKQATCRAYAHRSMSANILNLYQDTVSWHLKHVMPAFEFVKGGNLAVSLVCHFWYTLFVHLYI